MITTFYPPYHFGGDAMYIYRLCNELGRRGHQVDVIHCEDSYLVLQKKDSVDGFRNHENVRTYRLKSWVGALSPLLTQQTGIPLFKRRQISSVLKSGNHDVIHYHNMSLIGITALRYGQAVKLYTTHEHWLVCPMHVLWKFNREVCTARSCTLCQLKGFRPPQLWRHTGLLKQMVREVDCFISPSRFTLQKHREFGLEIPMAHIPYFLPKPQEPQGRQGSEPVPNDRPYFLYVGRLEKIKGVQNIIPLFKTREAYDLLIAGAGEYEETLRTLAADAPNVKFLGRLSPKELEQFYRRAIAVVVPSICYETMGIIIIEAFSMKTPVIVNNLGALPEVVADSGGGFVCNSSEQFLCSMDTLASNHGLRNHLGQRGYEAYLSRWAEDPHIDQYLNLIDGLQRKRQMTSTRQGEGKKETFV